MAAICHFCGEFSQKKLEFSQFSAQILGFSTVFHKKSLLIEELQKYGPTACLSLFIKARGQQFGLVKSSSLERRLLGVLSMKK